MIAWLWEVHSRRLHSLPGASSLLGEGRGECMDLCGELGLP